MWKDKWHVAVILSQTSNEPCKAHSAMTCTCCVACYFWNHLPILGHLLEQTYISKAHRTALTTLLPLLGLDLLNHHISHLMVSHRSMSDMRVYHGKRRQDNQATLLPFQTVPSSVHLGSDLKVDVMYCHQAEGIFSRIVGFELALHSNDLSTNGRRIDLDAL